MVFVDTSAWYSYFLPNDSAHPRVANWVRSNLKSIITTDYCVDETLTLLVARREIHRAMGAGRLFFEGNLARVHFVTAEQIHQAWVLFQQRAAAGWSFTDCTSHVVINALGIRIAAALDEHFRQFGNVQIVP